MTLRKFIIRNLLALLLGALLGVLILLVAGCSRQDLKWEITESENSGCFEKQLVNYALGKWRLRLFSNLSEPVDVEFRAVHHLPDFDGTYHPPVIVRLTAIPGEWVQEDFEMPNRAGFSFEIVPCR